jgi:hypothetical protein
MAKAKRRNRTSKIKSAPFKTQYVLFGLGADNRPRGAKLHVRYQKDITLAALSLGLRIGIADARHELLLKRLPRGRLHEAPDKAVAIIPKALLDELNAAVGGEPLPGPITIATARDHLKPGYLVLADDPMGGAGWFEAVIVGIKPGGRLRLKWRDRPAEGEFIRDAEHIALFQ